MNDKFERDGRNGCLAMGFGLLILLSVLFLVIRYAVTRIEDEFDDVESHVGSKVVIEDDTLIILDYSVLKNSYMLNDGKQISIESIDQFLLDNKEDAERRRIINEMVKQNE